MAFWQSLLRLNDWDIEFEVVRGFSAPETYAYIQADPREKSAKLSFVDPRDWRPEALTGDLVERTIVHELLHVHFRQAGFDYDEVSEELLVTQLEKILVSLRGD